MMDESTADLNERVAQFIEDHESEIVSALVEGFREEYPASNSNAMGNDALVRWSAAELGEFCQTLRGVPPIIRPHNVYEGDTAQNVDGLIQPITTFVEGRLFIIRTLAKIIWRYFNGPGQPIAEMLALLDATMLRIIRANLMSFAENDLVDGCLMRTWDFSTNAQRKRSIPRPGRIAATAEPSEPQLTPRELEIAALVVQGRTNGEIAAQLGLAQSTVKNRLVRIFDKLGVNTRVELTSRMMRDGVEPYRETSI